MSEHSKQYSDLDPVTEKEIDEVFKTVVTTRTLSEPGSKEWNDAHQLIDLLEKRIIGQRVEAAFEERRLQSEFYGGDESLDARLLLKYAMRTLDKKVELENLYNRRFKELDFIRPRAVSELTPRAEEQIEQIVHRVLSTIEVENVQLKARVAELEAQLSGKMIIPQSPFEVIPTAGEPTFTPKKED